MEKKVPEKSKKERKKEKQCFTKTGSKCWRSSFCRPVPEGNRSEWLGNLQLGRQLPACDVHQDPGQEGRLLSGGHSWAGGLPEEEELPGACWPGHPAHTLPHCLWACGRWRRGAWRSGDPHAAGGPFFILAFTYIYLWIFFLLLLFCDVQSKITKVSTLLSLCSRSSVFLYNTRASSWTMTYCWVSTREKAWNLWRTARGKTEYRQPRLTAPSPTLWTIFMEIQMVRFFLVLHTWPRQCVKILNWIRIRFLQQCLCTMSILCLCSPIFHIFMTKSQFPLQQMARVFLPNN